MPGSSALLIAAVERSKAPFFVAGGVLVVWALASAALGTRRASFPGTGVGLAAYLTATAALVLVTMGLAVATAGTDPAPPWNSANGDVRNHRVATGSEITASNVRRLGVAWTMPLTASSIYGTFAANPVTDSHGVVYLQDLQSNVFAVDLGSGRRLWSRRYDSQDIGPNGVVVSDGVVYGATAAFAFALDAQTGRELWRNTGLVPPARKKAGGELASGFGIDIQPQVANGRVYLSTGALLGGGIAYALDAKTGRTIWSFDTVTDPIGRQGHRGRRLEPAGDRPGRDRLPRDREHVPTGDRRPEDAGPAAVRRQHRGARRQDRQAQVVLPGRPERLPRLGPAALADLHRSAAGATFCSRPARWATSTPWTRATGKLIWKTKVGVHNGHDDDGELAMRHALRVPSKYTIEPGIVGGVETNMAVADGVVYVPVANLASQWSAKAGLGKADFGAGTGEMLALDLATGQDPVGHEALADGRRRRDRRQRPRVHHDVRRLPRRPRAQGRTASGGARSCRPSPTRRSPSRTTRSSPRRASPVARGRRRRSSRSASARTARCVPSAPSEGGAGGGAADGATVFSQNCSSCHTLAAAKAKGTVGPNLDASEADRSGGTAPGHRRRRRNARLRRPADDGPDRRRREVRRERRGDEVAGAGVRRDARAEIGAAAGPRPPERVIERQTTAPCSIASGSGMAMLHGRGSGVFSGRCGGTLARNPGLGTAHRTGRARRAPASGRRGTAPRRLLRGSSDA